MHRIVWTGILVSGIVISTQGQGKWNWPQDTATAREKVALYSDYMKAKKFRQSIEPLEWLLAKAPNLNPSIYIHGIKIYDQLASMEEIDSIVLSHQENVIALIDERQAFFGETSANKVRKAFYGYKYWSRASARYEEVFSWFCEAYNATDGNIGQNLIPAMMHMVCKTQASDDVFQWYLRFLERVEAEQLPLLNRMAFSCVSWTCDRIGQLWQALPEEVSNEKTSTLLLNLAIDNECIQEQFFKELAFDVIRKPDRLNLLKLVAKKVAAEGQWELAFDLYRLGLETAEDEDETLDLLMQQTLLYQEIGNYPDARRYARRALALRPGHGLAHELIGDMYFDSYQDCRQGVSRVADRAVFIAAYEQYEVAGAAAKMKIAKEQFPSGIEIFEELMTVGQVYTVGCWINESVVLDKRD